MIKCKQAENASCGKVICCFTCEEKDKCNDSCQELEEGQTPLENCDDAEEIGEVIDLNKQVPDAIKAISDICFDASEMKQISYQEAVELMAFGGRTDIYMGHLETAHDISIEVLRGQANDGIAFFIDDSEAWEKDKAVPAKPGSEEYEEVPVPGGVEGETVKLLKDESKPKFKAKKSKPKRKPVDKGKIMALHNAGRSGKQNAEEMDISPATVCNYLKDGGEKR